MAMIFTYQHTAKLAAVEVEVLAVTTFLVIIGARAII